MKLFMWKKLYQVLKKCSFNMVTILNWNFSKWVYISLMSIIYIFLNQLIWNKKLQGSKGKENVYQWGNPPQNFFLSGARHTTQSWRLVYRLKFSGDNLNLSKLGRNAWVQLLTILKATNMF